MPSTPSRPARHRPTTRTPGPLDSLPRPLSERDRRAGGRLGRLRPPRAVLLGGVLAAAVAIVITAMSHGPVGPAGAVAGVTAASASPAIATSGSSASGGLGGPGVTGPAASPTPEPPDSIDRVSTRPPEPPPVASLAGYRWPLAHARITLPFGPSPWGSRIVAGKHVHDGVDMATFCGDRVVAAHAGTVLAAGRHYDGQMGWVGDLTAYTTRLDRKHLWSTLPIVVVIDDGNGYRSIYAHFGKLVVKKGQVVKAGQLLGYEGRTGRASGCHLHYGLFSPLERNTFGIDKVVVKHLLLPAHQIARIDPLVVLPRRTKPASPAAPTASNGPAPSADSP